MYATHCLFMEKQKPYPKQLPPNINEKRETHGAPLYFKI